MIDRELYMPSLKIGDIEAKLPIIQGGMGVGVSLSGLASAVANQGGIGVIATAGIGMAEPDFVKNFKEANIRALRREIQTARKNSNGIIGVNIMMALTDYENLVHTAIEEDADLVFLGAGLPLKNPLLTFPSSKEIKTRLVPIVSSARAAKVLFSYWSANYKFVPDAVVVEGPMAGGHLGFKKEQIFDPIYTLENIIPQVIQVLKVFEEQYNKKIPVIAAGGVYTAADIKKYLDMGAKGVQMATRFVATHECDASPEFKQMYVDAKKEDIVIIDSPVGMPGRAIKNEFIQSVSDGFEKPFKCPWKCLHTCNYKTVPYCIALALTNAKIGELEHGFAFAGANAYRVDKIMSVKEVFDELKSDFSKL